MLQKKSNLYLLIFITAFFSYYFCWFLVFSLKINDLPIQSEDVLPSLFLPLVIIQDNSLYLNRYYDFMVAKYPQPDNALLTPFYLKKVLSYTESSQLAPGIVLEKNVFNYVSAFPIINSLLVLPVYLIYGGLFSFDYLTWNHLFHLNHLSASFISSLLLVAFYYYLKDCKQLSNVTSLLLVFILGFCTINFSLFSQSLWQHSTVQLFLVLVLIFLHKNKAFFTSLFFGLALLSRPSVLILLPFVYLLYLNKNLKNFDAKKWVQISFSFFLGILVCLIFFGSYTLLYYGGISNNGYYSQLDSWYSKFPEGLLGLLVSPSKGLFVYSPILVFIFYSLKNLKNNYENQIYWAIFISNAFIMGRWKHWYGGWSFGYRLLGDILPFIVLLLIPFITSKYFKKYLSLFGFLVMFSFCVHLGGIVFFDGIWHGAYDKGFRDTKWLWSLKNSEFTFNLRRVLVKLNYLDKACDVCLPSK